MKTEYLDIYENEWLINALNRGGYGDKIPSNVILNKTLTGIGATHCELYAHRNSIIIEPNVPVIQCKLENEDLSLLGVYSHVSIASIRKYFRNKDIQYKKILTTPESFYKVRNEAHKLGINIYGEDWFCLFDECEKITQDHDYRRSISQPISDFFMFDNKAMVSATPLTPSNPQFKAQHFSIIKIRPTFDYKKNLTLIATNNFTNMLRDIFIRLADSPCVCVFMNKQILSMRLLKNWNWRTIKSFVLIKVKRNYMSVESITYNQKSAILLQDIISLLVAFIRDLILLYYQSNRT